MNGFVLGPNNLGITKAHVTGFVVGVGVAATGYYVYMKNKDTVDAFLSKHGINVPTSTSDDIAEWTLEELLLRKEQIEDLIAEKELEVEQTQITAEA